MDPSQQPQQPQPQQPQFPPQQPIQPQQPVQPIQQIQPAMYQPPQMVIQQTGNVDPGATFGLLSLILSFFTGPVGVILGIVGLNKSKSVGLKNGKALAGIIIGSVVTVLTVIIVIVSLSSVNNAINDIKAECDAKNGTMTDEGDGTYRCKYMISSYE